MRFSKVLAACLLIAAFAAPIQAQLGNPDAHIKNSFDDHYIGDNVHNHTGLSQTKEQTVEPGETAVYHLRIQNDYDNVQMPDNIEVKGPESDSGWEIVYFDGIMGGADITDQVTTANGWSTGALDFGEWEQMRFEITPPLDAAPGSVFEVMIEAESTNEPTRYDVAVGITTVEGTVDAEETEPGTNSLNLTFVNDAAHITYTLAAESEVNLVICDITGRVIATLQSGTSTAGTHTFTCECSELASGVYFVSLRAGAYSAARKLVLVR
jgi:uncharacterized membrane protein